MSDKQKVAEDVAAIREHFAGSRETDKLAKILERVRGILALADSEQAQNPAAADNYRAQADVLMTQYAIEQWQVEAAQTGVNKRPEPEVRYFDFSWWYVSATEQASRLYSMFRDVAAHCRCVVASRGQGKNGSYKQMPVIGLPSDLDYFDMLFTHLMLQMGKLLEPKPSSDATFGENAYRLRAAGMARPRIAKMLYDIGMIPGTGEGTDYWNDTNNERVKYEWLPPNKEKSLRAKVRVAGEKWGAANGYDPTTTVNPKVWQRSFGIGFVQEISSRLRDMRKLRDAAPSGKENAIALRDMYQVSLALYEEMWPAPPPIQVDSTAVVKRSKGKSLVREVQISGTALNAGRKAGREVNLNSHPSKGLGQQKSLPK